MKEKSVESTELLEDINRLSESAREDYKQKHWNTDFYIPEFNKLLKKAKDIGIEIEIDKVGDAELDQVIHHSYTQGQPYNPRRIASAASQSRKLREIISFADKLSSKMVREIRTLPLQKELEKAETMNTQFDSGKIFIGHGGSAVWRDLKDFLQDRLGLEWDEFNRESVAGIATTERLETMLNNASFAFLIMTAEDEHADETFHARENVIHEIGLFQGRLGFRKAIILFEEGCQEFSNIFGLTQIRFPKGNIEAKFEEIRRVLEREGIIENKVTETDVDFVAIYEDAKNSKE